MNVKQGILHAVDALGLNRWARHRTRRRLLGLCYHGVVSEEGPPADARTRIAVTATQFEAQMRELRRHWTPVGSRRILDAISGGPPLPDRAVHVSFDDGYRNNLTVAAPILERYEIPATVFITSGFLDTRRPPWPLELHERLVACTGLLPILSGRFTTPSHTPERTEEALKFVDAAKELAAPQRENLMETLRSETEIDLSAPWKRELYEPLDWTDLPGLPRRGVEIGAHTVSHPNLARLAPDELDEEIETGRKKIEAAMDGAYRCESFAYPFGSSRDYSDAVVDAVRKAGFRLAFTLEERRNAETLDPFRIHRICIHRELTHASFLTLISGLRNN